MAQTVLDSAVTRVSKCENGQSSLVKVMLLAELIVHGR